MRRSLTLALFCLAVPALGPAQTPTDPIRLLSDIRDNLRSYMQDASTRSRDLSRKIGVLRSIADGTSVLRSIEMNLSQVRTNFVATAAHGVTTAIHVRRLALK